MYLPDAEVVFDLLFHYLSQYYAYISNLFSFRLVQHTYFMLPSSRLKMSESHFSLVERDLMAYKGRGRFYPHRMKK